MRKLILALLLALCCVSTYAANRGSMRVIANTGISGMGGSLNRIAYRLGLGYAYPVSDVFFVEGDLVYASRGNEDIRMCYVELPVTGVFKLGGICDVSVGPYAAVLLSGTQTTSSKNHLDAGIQVGAQIHLPSFSLGVTYQKGIFNCIRGTDMKNQGLHFSFGFALPY